MKVIFEKHIIIGIIAIFLLISCSSSEQKYIKELQKLTEYVDSNSGDLSSTEWNIALEQYDSLRQQREVCDYRFSHNESTRIDSCYRVLNAAMAKSFIKIGTDKVDGFLNEFINLIDDIAK